MMTRTFILAFAFLAAGCGKSACDEIADCLGTENDGSVDEEDCQTALDVAEEADLCE
jgi:hypothetical protein